MTSFGWLQKIDHIGRLKFGLIFCFAALTACAGSNKPGGDSAFAVEELTIAGLHQAIQSGKTTCKQVVQAYVDRARAYNGICTALVTEDGAPVAVGEGVVRAGAPLKFPTQTVAITEILPDFDQYAGLPIEFGRMEVTKSDPQVQQQFGMVVGIPGINQVNALNTLNLRGERSVTCKGTCDTHPDEGGLPGHCPVACEAFRAQPDALERAAELDAKYGHNPDLEAMPMYCTVMSFKEVFDTKDIRNTGGADADYAMDVPSEDATVVARLRARGAIIYAQANLSEYNGGGGNPGGDAVESARTYGAGARSTWGGTACNAYDSTRETGGSSAGSGASVGANLVMCSICEETGGSCRQPAWRNGVVGLMGTKGVIPYGGGIGADPYLDRAGINCRTVKDAAIVLDALREPGNDSSTGFYDARDIYTAVPKNLLSNASYAGFAVDKKVDDMPLKGMRLGVVREYMVKHSANDVVMSDIVNDEIKNVLRDRLGAELVESHDPEYPDDPSIEQMSYTFQDALAEILPVHMPGYFFSKGDDGELLFSVPGHDVTSIEYLVQLAEGKAPLSTELNIRSINESPRSRTFSFHLTQYLDRRGDARITNWSTLNANAKYGTDARRAAMKNWENVTDLRSEGVTQRISMREVMRLVVLKVMHENQIDAFVNPTITIPPALIGYAAQPTVKHRPLGRFPTSALLGIPEITVPAGFNDVIYEPGFAMNETRDDYVPTANETQPTVAAVPLPVGISFWGGPGDEPVLIKVASIYEAATQHRKPPAALGPVNSRP